MSLSLNPAIDLTYEITGLTHDQKSRATKTYYHPGGTGINVGRALEKLKANSHTCSITAGVFGELLNTLLKQELKNHLTLCVEGETRINTTLLQQSPLQQFEINAAGPNITLSQLNEISEKFLALCGQGIGILTGSLPLGIPDDTYKNISIQLKSQGARAIIDAPVAILKQALHSHPFLIKPNLHELETLQNKQLLSVEEVAAESRIIAKKGTQNICVSLGEKGAILTTPDNSYYCYAPAITTFSTVGSGDALVAGLAFAFVQNKTPEQALQFAIACGTNSAEKPGTQLFNLEEVKQLLPYIKIKTLHI